MLQKDEKVISGDEKALIRQLKEAGFSQGDTVGINQLRMNHQEVWRYARGIAPTINGKVSIAHLFNELGFSTKRTPDIKRKLTAELAAHLDLDTIVECLDNGGLPSHRQLRTELKSMNAYMLRRSRGEDLPPVRELFDGLHPEYPNLSALITGHVRYEDMTQTEVSCILKKMYFHGKDISPSALLSQKANAVLGRWLMTYSTMYHKGRICQIQRKRDITEAIQKLTGIKPKYFSIRNAKQIKTLGNINEFLLRTILRTSMRLDPYSRRQPAWVSEVFPSPITQVYPPNGSMKKSKGVRLYRKDDSYIYADAVVHSPEQSCMVEIKNLRTIDNRTLHSLEERLDHEASYEWRLRGQHREISDKAFVLIAPDRQYAAAQKRLGESTRMISPHEFRDALAASLSQIEAQGYIRKNVYAPEQILTLYDILHQKPHLLIRKGNEQTLSFLDTISRELLTRLEHDKKAPPKEPLSIYGSEGELVRNDDGIYQRFIIPLSTLPDTHESRHTKRYVTKRLHKIKDDEVFFDVESTGFVGKQIFLLGTAYKQEGELIFELDFARNPSEEKAMLNRFLDICEDKRVYTYNGRSYDFPAVKDRMFVNLIDRKLPEDHLDLYLHINKRHKDRRGSLKLYDFIELFGDVRDDIKSSLIPLMYSRWVRYGNPESICNSIEHNVLDLMTTAAIRATPSFYVRGD